MLLVDVAQGQDGLVQTFPDQAATAAVQPDGEYGQAVAPAGCMPLEQPRNATAAVAATASEVAVTRE